MERDDSTSYGSARTGSTAGGTGSESGIGAGGTASVTGEASGNVIDRARDIASTAQEKLADVGTTVREKTGSAKDSLADALESGAEKLRQRASGGRVAGATAGGGTVTMPDGRVTQITDRVASGMDATADWLREADLDSMRAAVERQVREHPGRTLLIAAGIGYLIGKAFRSSNS